jgi:hypothetical protein
MANFPVNENDVECSDYYELGELLYELNRTEPEEPWPADEPTDQDWQEAADYQNQEFEF